MAVKKRTVKKAPVKKRVVKKKAVKKRVGTSSTKKSVVTGKKPTKRLVKRRAKNTKAGYYPNPLSRAAASRVRPTRKSWIVGMKHKNKTVYVSATLDGYPAIADTDIKKAVPFSTAGLAKDAARKLQNEYDSAIVFVKTV